MLVLRPCTTWRAGEGQDPSLLRQGKAAEDKGWPRATPAAAKCGVQLHLVGSEAPQVSPGPFGHHTGTRCLKSWSLWPYLLCHHKETEPGDGSLVPGLRLLQHLGMLGQHQPVDAHAKAAACTRMHLHTHTHVHSLCSEHQDSWCRGSRAPVTWPACTEAPMCLQEEVKWREPPPCHMEAILRGRTTQFLPAWEVWE